MLKSFSIRDVLYIAAILGSSLVTQYRVGELEKAMVEVKAKYVTTEANDLQHQKLELEIVNSRLEREKDMLALEMRLTRGIK